MKIEKLKIETIKRVRGSTINERWNADMYWVNGTLLASDISRHNRHGWKFDFVEGETADVVINSSGWIARDVPLPDVPF
jgi:hypothetical protein